MSRTRRYLGRKAIERLPGPVLDLIGPAILKAVDTAVEQRWPRALEAAAAADGDTAEERSRSITRRFRRELTAVGAATGAVAATPGLGTATAASALAADVGWLAIRAADLIMAIGAARGHTEASVEERRAWVLAVLAFGESAPEEFENLISAVDIEILPDGDRLREGLGKAAGLASGDALTVDTLRRVNASLATQVTVRYGSRRGAVTLGKLLPFGIGAVWGGASTWGLIRGVGKNAERFFANGPRTGPPPPTGPALPPPHLPPPDPGADRALPPGNRG